MSDSVAYQIVEAVRNRLAGIDFDSGYNTDMGASLFLGKRQFNEHEMSTGPQLQFYMTEDTPSESDRHVDPMMIELGFVAAAAAEVKNDNALKLASDLIQDIKSAVLVIGGETLGGLSLDLGYSGSTIDYPEGGVDSVVVTVNFTALYQETYGAP